MSPHRPSQVARRLLDSLPGRVALRALDRADTGRSDLVAVLTYHRVAPRHGLVGAPGLVSASPAEFDDQVSFLARRHRVVTLNDLLESRESGRHLGRRAVVITFDDAHRDFAEHAWPVLKRYRLPATMFVPTAFPDDPEAVFWWDWLHEAVAGAPDGTAISLPDGRVRFPSGDRRAEVYRRIRDEVKRRPHAEAMSFVRQLVVEQLGVAPPTGTVLGWDELRNLSADGVTLAPHSRTHPLLDRVRPDELNAEIAGSREDLERQVGTAPAAFAYPSGAHSPEVRDAVARAGIRVAFTTRRGLNRLGVTDWLALRRINVGGSTSVQVLRAQLGRWAVAWS